MDTATTIAGRSVPWNKGKLLDQKPPLRLKEIWAIRIRLQLDHRARELALFNLEIDSKLRGCELVGLRVHDVIQGSQVSAREIVMQKKTQRPVQFEITEQTQEAVAAWVQEAHRQPEQFLFPITAAHQADADLPRLGGVLTHGSGSALQCTQALEEIRMPRPMRLCVARGIQTW